MTSRRLTNATTRRKARTAEAQAPADAAEATTGRFRLLMRHGDWQPIGEVVLRHRCPSRLDVKQEAMDAVAEACISRGWVHEEERSWLVLCLDEAITNAMLHGNEGDPRLEVEVALAADAKRWQIAVSDQGSGFTMASVPDPDDPGSLLLEHGRGIRLMRAWLGSLTYWRRGATVVLSRRHSPPI